MKILLFLLSVSELLAQSGPAVVNHKACRSSSQVQVFLTVPATAAGITVSIPICAELGTGLRLNTSTATPKLEIDPSVLPTPIIPRAVIQRFPLPVDLPATTTVFNVSLSNTPVSTAAILVAFRSSRATGDVVDFLKPGGGTNPKVLNVMLPEYRPFTTDDVLTVMYWTVEAP